MILVVVVQFDLELEQMDVKTTFLHCDLKECIYMVQPIGYINQTYPEHVCLLKKSLYGLKQSPRQWYKKFDSFVLGIGFERSKYDNCFYFILPNIHVYLLLYVDDILIISKSKEKISELKAMFVTPRPRGEGVSLCWGP